VRPCPLSECKELVVVKSCRDHTEISDEVISKHEFQPIDTSFKEPVIIRRPSMKLMELIAMPSFSNDLSDGELLVTSRDLSLGEIIITSPVRQSMMTSASNNEMKMNESNETCVDHHVRKRSKVQRAVQWMRSKFERFNCFCSVTN